jgi:tight adherence protein B
MKRLLLLLIPLLGIGIWGASATPAAAQGQTAADSEVIMLIDTSGSMTPVIRTAETAAHQFVARMPAKLRIGLQTFAGVLAQPTTYRGLLTQKIDAITTGGETPLYDAVITASRTFAPGGQHILVILSDGGNTSGTSTLAQAAKAVGGVHVEAISLTTNESDPRALAALGRVTPVNNPAALSAAFQRVANLLIPVVLHIPPKPAPRATAAPPVTATHPVTSAPAPAPVRATHSSSPSSIWLVFGGLAVFGALFTAVVLSFPRQRVSRARLGINQPRTASEIGSRTLSVFEEALERHGKRDDLATALSVAQIGAKPGEFVAFVLVASLVLALVGLFLAGPLLAAALLVIPPIAARVYVQRRRNKRQQAFAEQLPDVLKLVTTSLRSGFGLTQSLDSVAQDAQEPARSEFAHMLVEVRLGRDLTDALRAVALRMGSQDMQWVVSAVEINRDTGGNLSEVVNQVSETVLERQRMRRQVLTYTAEGRLSARILVAMPIVIGLWQWRTNHHFSVLFHGTGFAILLATVALMGVGALWIRKLVNNVSL